ncbi:MAG TPA: GNAT family N-acetyltransferase [Anaerolineales bacterium]|nr:GNAT family N-acetyltransferase [Anaerolineales bacterium]
MAKSVNYKNETIINGEPFRFAQETISAEEYIDFLARSDLGQQYPKEDFVNRINTLVGNVQISLVVRNTENKIIGVCFGLTDFAYWLLLTDLGVDRKYARLGIGKILVETAHELAGGEKNIVLCAYVNDKAIPFYEKLGMRKSDDVMEKANIDWTPFEVGKDN